MWKFSVCALAMVVGVGGFASTAAARKLPHWPYERLFKEADLVVIARAVDTAACADRTTENLWRIEFIGVNTTVTLQSVLKGKVEGNTIRVLHFQVKDGVKIEDGPSFVTFRTRTVSFQTKSATVELGAPDYMLFLKA